MAAPHSDDLDSLVRDHLQGASTDVLRDLSKKLLDQRLNVLRDMPGRVGKATRLRPPVSISTSTSRRR